MLTFFTARGLRSVCSCRESVAWFSSNAYGKQTNPATDPPITSGLPPCVLSYASFRCAFADKYNAAISLLLLLLLLLSGSMFLPVLLGRKPGQVPAGDSGGVPAKKVFADTQGFRRNPGRRNVHGVGKCVLYLHGPSRTTLQLMHLPTFHSRADRVHFLAVVEVFLSGCRCSVGIVQ